MYVAMLAILISTTSFADGDGLRCKKLKGHIVTHYVFQNCESPFGICTEGTIEGNGFLNGSTRYVVTDIGPVAGDPNMQGALSYRGTLVVKTRHGNLMIKDLGMFDRSSALFSSQSRDISGENKLEGVSGMFFSYGIATETGFDGYVKGQLCM